MLRFRSRVLRFRVLGASFSRFRVLRFRDLGCFVFDLGCFVFEIWVLRFRVLGASCFGLRFRVLRFRNYRERRLLYCRSGARKLEVRPFRRYLHNDIIFESLKSIYSNGDDLTKKFCQSHCPRTQKKKLEKVLALYQQHPGSLVP